MKCRFFQRYEPQIKFVTDIYIFFNIIDHLGATPPSKFGFKSKCVDAVVFSSRLIICNSENQENYFYFPLGENRGEKKERTEKQEKRTS